MKPNPFIKQIYTENLNGLYVVKQEEMKPDPFIKQTQANLGDQHVVKQKKMKPEPFIKQMQTNLNDLHVVNVTDETRSVYKTNTSKPE